MADGKAFPFYDRNVSYLVAKGCLAMKTKTYPVNVVIGRIVVQTRNHFLAREVERMIEQSRLPERMSSGSIRINGEDVEWVLLPSSTGPDQARHR